MAEINAQQHIGKIFAAAQKLMEARRQLAAAKFDAEESEAELERLNGSTSLDLGRFDDTRYFECEGDPKVRLEFGAVPPDPKAGPEKCNTVIPVPSWRIERGAQRPKEVLMCSPCLTAHQRKEEQENPKKAAEAKKKNSELEVAF